MQSKSLGLILSAKLIRDNDLYIKILSVNDKILSGFVYGGNSTKKRHTYQLGYFIEFNQIQKNSNSINSINGEIVKPYIESIYNDKFKSFSLLAIVSIINESVYEGVKIDNLFKSVKELVDLINESKHWLSNYCRWLLYFLKLFPVYSCLGLPILLIGSSIISFHCDTHPTVLPIANKTVNMLVGKPIDFKIMPE